MKEIILFLFIITFCQPVMAQSNISSIQIISVKAGNNQKDSTFAELNLSQKEPFKLSYDQNYVHFSFINTKNAPQKSFSYKLVGLDYSWITCDNCTQVQYAHLDGGDYTFQVKNAKSDEPPTKFSFVVEGNIWHKWWFVPMLFMYFLAFLGIGIYLFVLYRFRQKLKEQRYVHKEKMSSMTELTTGIAHEIQNPLNFVNNFSELSMDLAKELKEEIENIEMPEKDKEYINEILGDLTLNQEKINHHGKRASNIVNGMLEHSKISTGNFELTDLNKLIEENIIHSLSNFKTKNKEFNIEYELNKEQHLPKVKIIPQEISRVFLNLFNNAFYAVKEISTIRNPKFVVSTQLTNNVVIIKIQDNGTGMSEATKAKIFQPFFTTKPTGQGTGLGLSLAYNIITKGHGGTIDAESVEGEGTTFIVKIPV